jgi:diguanylate cyclase (GGDEF)-like protein/PAS domain S-box-containing protein
MAEAIAIRPHRNGLLFGIAAASVAGLLVFSWLFINLVSEAGNTLEQRILASMATIAARGMDAQLVAKLTGSARDADSDTLAAVRGELRQIRNAVPNARFTYLVAERNGGVVFLADGEDQTSADYSPPGQSYPEAPPTLRHVLTTLKPEATPHYRDRWGEWASGFAPIVEPGSQKVLAILGIDVPSNQWREEVEGYRSFGEVIVGVIATLFGVALFLQAHSQRKITLLNYRLKAEVDELATTNRIVENSSTLLLRASAEDQWPVTYVSRNIERYGYGAQEILAPGRIWSLFHPEDIRDMREDMEDLRTGKSNVVRRQIRFRKGDNSWAWLDATITAIRDEKGCLIGIEGLMSDITGIKQAEDRIAYLAAHDGLTGLANRAAFMERLQLACADAQRSRRSFAVLYLDMDHFKDINDTFGHENGDQLLQLIAERLSVALRQTDALARISLARFGGDEFAILQLDIAEASDAASLALRLLNAMSQPFMLAGKEIHATCSIGISLCEKGATLPDDLLVQADLALYRAKEGGRAQFHFHSADLDVQVRERVAIGEELYTALKTGQLQLYYQPQVEIPSGRITGLEALIRWNHPVRGMVSPAEFIPIAEKSGLIVALGSWVIAESCRQIEAWRAEGIVVPLVGVNVAAAQFRNPEALVAEVASALQKLHGGTGVLELELTESTLLDTGGAHGDVLQRLRAAGARIAIDDFGTGFSSLQYLHAYPVDRIKIAQEFMRRTTTDSGAVAIVKATIGLAEALKLQIIAEGVETLEQLTFLSKAGCRNIQGYYFSQPLPADAIAPLLRHGRFDRPWPAPPKPIPPPPPSAASGQVPARPSRDRALV